MENKKINSIITVNVNGVGATEVINSVKTRLETVEKSAFNIAILVGYGIGLTIPSHVDSKGNEHGDATCDKPIKQKDFIKLVGRSESTISRWLKAFRLILEKGYFNDFAYGKYPFSFDKIITIFENEEVFNGYVFSDLMGLSAVTLSTMVKDSQKNTTSEEEEEEEETSEEEKEDFSDESQEEETSEEEEEVEKATLSYDGKEYLVPKALFEKWLSENGTLNIKH